MKYAHWLLLVLVLFGTTGCEQPIMLIESPLPDTSYAAESVPLRVRFLNVTDSLVMVKVFVNDEQVPAESLRNCAPEGDGTCRIIVNDENFVWEAGPVSLPDDGTVEIRVERPIDSIPVPLLGSPLQTLLAGSYSVGGIAKKVGFRQPMIRFIDWQDSDPRFSYESLFHFTADVVRDLLEYNNRTDLESTDADASLVPPSLNDIMAQCEGVTSQPSKHRWANARADVPLPPVAVKTSLQYRGARSVVTFPNPFCKYGPDEYRAIKLYADCVGDSPVMYCSSADVRCGNGRCVNRELIGKNCVESETDCYAVEASDDYRGVWFGECFGEDMSASDLAIALGWPVNQSNSSPVPKLYQRELGIIALRTLRSGEAGIASIGAVWPEYNTSLAVAAIVAPSTASPGSSSARRTYRHVATTVAHEVMHNLGYGFDPYDGVATGVFWASFIDAGHGNLCDSEVAMQNIMCSSDAYHLSAGTPIPMTVDGVGILGIVNQCEFARAFADASSVGVTVGASPRAPVMLRANGQWHLGQLDFGICSDLPFDAKPWSDSDAPENFVSGIQMPHSASCHKQLPIVTVGGRPLSEAITPWPPVEPEPSTLGPPMLTWQSSYAAAADWRTKLLNSDLSDVTIKIGAVEAIWNQALLLQDIERANIACRLLAGANSVLDPDLLLSMLGDEDPVCRVLAATRLPFGSSDTGDQSLLLSAAEIVAGWSQMSSVEMQIQGYVAEVAP